MLEALTDIFALRVWGKLIIVGLGDGAAMAGHELIDNDTFGGVGWLLDLGRVFFQGRCRCRSNES